MVADTPGAAAPYLTSADVGALLGKSQRTVQRLVTDGRLRASQKLPGPNGPYLFSREDVDALLAEMHGTAA